MHREKSGEGQEFLYAYKLCQNKNAKSRVSNHDVCIAAHAMF